MTVVTLFYMRRKSYLVRGAVSFILAVALVLPAPPHVEEVRAGRTAPLSGERSHAAPSAVAETISPAGGDAFSQGVAIDADGNAYVVWARSEGGDSRIQIRRRSPSGNLSPVQTLSAAGQDASGPQVAVTADGVALVVWSRWDGNGHHQIRLVRRAPSGNLSPVRTLSAFGTDAYGPQIAMDRDGNAVVVWSSADGPAEMGGPYRVQLRRRFASGDLGPIENLSLGEAGSPQVAMDRDGNALAVWAGTDGANSRIRLRRHSKAGTLGEVQTLSPQGHNARNPQIAVDANGNALVVWSREGFGTERIQLRRRSASGGLSAIQTLTTTQVAQLPQIAINRHGSALIVWQRYNGTNWKIQLRRRSPSGGLSDVRAVSPAGMDAFRPQLAIDAANHAWVSWQRYDGSAYSIQVRERTSLGHLGTIQTLSAAGPRASDPPAAIDARRIVVAVWGEYDGTNFRIRAAQLSP